MNPLDLYGLAANPLFAAGTQILANSQPGPVYRPVMGGVPQAMGNSLLQARMMQNMASEQELNEYERKQRIREEQDRARRDAALAGMGGVAPGQLNPYLLGSGDPELAMMGARGTQAEAQARIKAQMEAEQTAAQQRFTAEQNDLNRQARINAAMRGRAETPYYDFLPTPEGYVAGNTRTGTATRVMVDGMPVVKSSDSPVLQGELAGAKKGAQVRAQSQTQAQIDLPKVEEEANYTIGLLDKMATHPGMKVMVGKSSMLMPKGGIPGTASADFAALRGQLAGKQFLQAYETLKGGGQITEIEGTKAENAYARMQTAQTEEAFVEAAREFQGVIKKAVERARTRAGVSGATSDGGKARLRFNPATGQLE